MLRGTLFQAAWLFLRPPKASELTARASFGRAMRRWIITLLVVVPLGLALAHLMDRYPKHPLTLLTRRLLGEDARPEPGEPATN